MKYRTMNNQYINIDTTYLNTPSAEQVVEQKIKDLITCFDAVVAMPCSRKKVELLSKLRSEYEIIKDTYMSVRDIVAYTGDSHLNTVIDGDTERLDAIQFIASFCEIISDINTELGRTQKQLIFMSDKPSNNPTKASFRNYLITKDSDGLLAEIKALADKKKGIHIAMIIIALIRLELIRPFGNRNELYSAISEFLGHNIGTKSALNPTMEAYEAGLLSYKHEDLIKKIELQLVKYKRI